MTARLAVPFRWLMVTGIAYTLATGTLALLAGPTARPAPATESGGRAGGSSAQPVRAPVNIEPLLARNLFGVAGQGVGQTASESAVTTQLPLELQGVFVAANSDESAAIIAVRGRPGERYHIGQSISGSATLEGVFADHVILRRAGSAEKLSFPKSGKPVATTVTGPDPSPQPAETGASQPMRDDYPAVEAEGDMGAGNATASFAEYRTRFASDPATTLASIGMSAVEGNAASGYRVDSLAAVPYLAQTGLQSGDVVLSINGHKVGDFNQDRLAVDQVLAQKTARIEVLRGSRRFFVTASLP